MAVDLVVEDGCWEVVVKEDGHQVMAMEDV
jgi:hypothetical protein